MNPETSDPVQQGACPAPALMEDPQAEVERLQRELAQARSELEDFTHSVSHDLRASLRHVNAYVQLIHEDLGQDMSTELAAHLNTVRQAAAQMTRQIDGLTELSRLGRIELHCDVLALAPLAQEVIMALAPTLDGRPIEWQVAADIPPLRADAALLGQVLTHLLSNAVKATRTRSPARITISWQMHSSGGCALTVTDNGIGFKPQYAQQLFHVFQRLHPAREFEGLGMGLALSRKIIERHGGTVWASGAVEAGCSVSFTLPLA